MVDTPTAAIARDRQQSKLRSGDSKAEGKGGTAHRLALPEAAVAACLQLCFPAELLQGLRLAPRRPRCLLRAHLRHLRADQLPQRPVLLVLALLKRLPSLHRRHMSVDETKVIIQEG